MSGQSARGLVRVLTFDAQENPFPLSAQLSWSKRLRLHGDVNDRTTDVQSSTGVTYGIDVLLSQVDECDIEALRLESSADGASYRACAPDQIPTGHFGSPVRAP